MNLDANLAKFAANMLSMLLSVPALTLRAAPLRALAPAVRARMMSGAGPNDQGVEYAVKKTAGEWADQLSEMQNYVLRQAGTERPGEGEYDKFYPKDGHFACAGCAQPLYSAAAKFDSGCGWPAFDRIVEGAVVTKTDTTLGMSRVEILCSGCGGHLGHVFEGEGFSDTMERHCVNSISTIYVDGPLPDGTTELAVLKTRPKKSGLLDELMGK